MCVDENIEEEINLAQENCLEGGGAPCAMSSTVLMHFSGTEMLNFS